MNQARSVYQNDYAPFDWNSEFTDDVNSKDFCSPENVDDCLKFISQEFGALGYSSFYSTTTSYPYAVNCDIVNFLNGTFELIERCRRHGSQKEKLEDKNRRLFSDLSAMTKKNSQLKENLELADSRIKSSSEKERQLKERNNQLLQAIKSEKDENRKLVSQIQHQEGMYQREMRKCETNMNQMKSRLHQVLTDKSSDKKVAGISSSGRLQLEMKQRGKWKNGAVASSNLEEMYKTVISSYEQRSAEMWKEIVEYRQCLEFGICQILQCLNVLDESCVTSENSDELKAAWNAPDKKNVIEQRFSFLLNKLKETAFGKQKQCKTCKSVMSNKSKNLLEDINSEQPVSCDDKIQNAGSRDNMCTSLSDLNEQISQLEIEKKKLCQEKSNLSNTASFIEKAKVELEIQKLKLLKMAMKRNMSQSELAQNYETHPSFAVITTKDSLTSIPPSCELQQCLNFPSNHQLTKSLTPLWEADYFKTVQDSRSICSPAPHFSRRKTSPYSSSHESPSVSDSTNSDLPQWASSLEPVLPSPARSDLSEPLCCKVVTDTSSIEEIEPSLSSSLEQNLDLLTAVAKDIEERRGSSPK